MINQYSLINRLRHFFLFLMFFGGMAPSLFALDPNGWSEFSPAAFDTSEYPLTHLRQPGSRIFYISESGSNATGEMYFWNGSAIVDSQGSSTGAGGVPYGTDPMNPTGPIRPYRSWVYVAPRGYSNAFQCNGDVGAPWDGTYAGVPGSIKPCTRTGYPDWWLFKRGDTFDLYNEYLSYARETNPGLESISHGSLAMPGGRSETEKSVIGAYGSISLPRPRFINPIGSFIDRFHEPDPKHMAYLSLHFDGRGGSRRGSGVFFLYQTSESVDNLIEDCWFDAVAGGMIIEETSMQITIRRTVVTDSYVSDGSHNQGLFWHGHPDARLRIEECLFMRNGMSHGDPEVTGWPPSSSNGQYWDIYNRNFYLSGESQNMESGIFDTISMLGASGDQTRGGMQIENNFFYQGYVSQGGHGGYPDSYGPTGTFRNNVLQRFQGQGTTDNRGQPGWGMSLGSGANEVEVSGNIVTNAQYNGSYAFQLSGSVGWTCYSLIFHQPTRRSLIHDNIFDSGPAAAAIDIEDGVSLDVLDCSQWQYPGLTNNNVFNNTIINSHQSLSRYVPLPSAMGTTHDTNFSNNSVYSSRLDAATALNWPDPNRTLKTYVESLGQTVTSNDGFIEFFNQARLQRKGNWRPEYTASAINNYIRSGFGIQGPPPPLANNPPQVNAGPDQNIVWPQNTVSLRGIVNDDGQPNPPGQMTYQWSRVSGPGMVQFSSPQSLTTTAMFSERGVYVLRLSASDSIISNYDDVRVTIMDSSASDIEGIRETRFNACFDPRNRAHRKNMPICYQTAEQGHVTLTIYAPDGREVRKLKDEDRSPGTDTILWDGKNEAGDLVSSGVYIAILESNGKIKKTKIPVIR